MQGSRTRRPTTTGAGEVCSTTCEGNEIAIEFRASKHLSDDFGLDRMLLASELISPRPICGKKTMHVSNVIIGTSGDEHFGPTVLWHEIRC
jgi:hypothetical protein